MGDGVILTAQAEVAELADAQDLGSCGRKAVGVQLPPSAPKFPFERPCPGCSASKGFLRPATGYSLAIHAPLRCTLYCLGQAGGARTPETFRGNEKIQTKRRKK